MRPTCDRHSLFACCSLFVEQNALKTSKVTPAVCPRWKFSPFTCRLSKASHISSEWNWISAQFMWSSAFFLFFELLLACLVFPSMINQRPFIHVGDSYCDHHGQMPWFALQMWSQRTSSVCPGGPEVKMTLPSILFWISVLSFHITGLIYLGLKGA